MEGEWSDRFGGLLGKVMMEVRLEASRTRKDPNTPRATGTPQGVQARRRFIESAFWLLLAPRGDGLEDGGGMETGGQPAAIADVSVTELGARVAVHRRDELSVPGGSLQDVVWVSSGTDKGARVGGGGRRGHALNDRRVSREEPQVERGREVQSRMRCRR